MIKRIKYIDRIIQACKERDTVLFLVGARQVGKTTLIQSLFEFGYFSTENSRSISGDEIFDLSFSTGNDFISFVKREKDPSKLEYLIIDEAQYIKNIGIILKQLIDLVRAKKYNFKLIVSGSGSLNVFKGMSDSLIGRKEIIQIFPFDFEEFLFAKGIKLVTTETNLVSYQKLFEEYIVFGGYPKVVLSNDPEEKKKIFINLINDYLFKDVALLLQERELMNFKKFLKLIATKVGNLISLESLLQEAGISRYILEKYLFVVENTFLYNILHGFVGGKNQGEIKKQVKLYINDIGILRYLLGTNEFIGDLRGKVVENFVYLSLLQQKKDYQSIYFRNTKNGAEVDFILKDEFTQTITPIEAKSGKKDNITRSYINFLETYNSDISGGIITTDNFYKKRTVLDKSIVFTPYLYIGDHI